MKMGKVDSTLGDSSVECPATLRFSGFLPLCYKKDNWWMLLGEESDGWGAFGGGPEPSDEGDCRATAIREAVEESHGVLSIDAMAKAVRHCRPLVCSDKAVVFGVVVPWGTSNRLNRLLYSQRAYAPIGGCFEKKSVLWLPLTDLQYEQRKHRKYYYIKDLKLRAPLRISIYKDTTLHTLRCLRQHYCWHDWQQARGDCLVQFMNRKCNIE